MGSLRQQKASPKGRRKSGRLPKPSLKLLLARQMEQGHQKLQTTETSHVFGSEMDEDDPIQHFENSESNINSPRHNFNNDDTTSDSSLSPPPSDEEFETRPTPVSQTKRKAKALPTRSHSLTESELMEIRPSYVKGSKEVFGKPPRVLPLNSKQKIMRNGETLCLVRITEAEKPQLDAIVARYDDDASDSSSSDADTSSGAEEEDLLKVTGEATQIGVKGTEVASQGKVDEIAKKAPADENIAKVDNTFIETDPTKVIMIYEYNRGPELDDNDDEDFIFACMDKARGRGLMGLT